MSQNASKTEERKAKLPLMKDMKNKIKGEFFWFSILGLTQR
jgi:hypothetical protein